ncbi:MAG: glycosyltransferase family 4 protein [Actinomycetota bacterium]|nr:glycosyltransferase family 4 protein [Actinomycetota bacterium]
MGVHVTETTEILPSLAEVDVVHGWLPDLRTVRMARQCGVPVVLSTIYWPSDRSVPSPWSTRLRYASALAWHALRREHARAAREVLSSSIYMALLCESADLLLPNSRPEVEHLVRELGVSTPWRVVPNGADPEVFSNQGAPSWEERSGVIYVGRIEPHKNTLSLIQAMRQINLDLTIVGEPHPHHPDYVRRCHRAAGPHTQFMSARPQDVLPDLLRRARVHVLPSWYETTGLVSLEAALCGCNVVSTSLGHATDYLGPAAWYCDPASQRSIRAAVLAAHDAQPRGDLAKRIRDRFTWQHAAASTLGAYEQVLAARNRLWRHE